jgi:hypothetical protein
MTREEFGTERLGKTRSIARCQDGAYLDEYDRSQFIPQPPSEKAFHPGTAEHAPPKTNLAVIDLQRVLKPVRRMSAWSCSGVSR